MASFAERYGPWALIAGASEGLGAAFCRQLAARGLNVALVARREGPLEALAAELRAAHAVDTRCFALDLAKREDLEALARGTEALDVGLLVMNAALAPIGEFLERGADEHRALLALNCGAALALSHAFGQRFVARGKGGVVFMSSLASLQGTALTAHYSASKAYLRVLAEGLWEELGPKGVDVTCCLAGPTDTPTWERGGARPVGLFQLPRVQPADDVVAATLRALGKTPVVVPSAMNRAVDFLMRRVLPTPLAVRLVSGTTRKMYGR